MSRNVRYLATVALIPLLALAATIALGATPWGEVYRTLMTEGAGGRVAAVRLEGFEKPEVEFEVAREMRGAYVVIELRGDSEDSEDEEDEGIRLSVPGSWKLQEVRGVHVRDVMRQNEEDQQVLLLPESGKLRMVFTAYEPFDAIAFSHDSSTPALVTLTAVSLPDRRAEKTVQLVESAWHFAL